MNIINRCMHCMGALPEGSRECPHCGNTYEARLNYPDALPPKSILGTKYIVGEALARDKNMIRYIGFDVEKNIKVYIDELFPEGLAHRSAVMPEISVPSDKGPLFAQSVKSWLSYKADDRLRQNGTAYRVSRAVSEESGCEEVTVISQRKAQKATGKPVNRHVLGATMVVAGALICFIGVSSLIGLGDEQAENEISIESDDFDDEKPKESPTPTPASEPK